MNTLVRKCKKRGKLYSNFSKCAKIKIVYLKTGVGSNFITKYNLLIFFHQIYGKEDQKLLENNNLMIIV